MANFNDSDEIKKQYETSTNLNSRMMLHQLFSTNKQGWSNWVFQNYELKPSQVILELGCGSGGVWKSNAHSLPSKTKLVLSDFSSGMLESAKENTKSIQNIQYQVVDAQEIPFENDKFDIVIANHMLYHVSNIDSALSEISRVLKPDGLFYATTIGQNNFREVINLLHDFDSNIDFAQAAITQTFGLESGKTKLERHFNSVDVKRYPDSLHITESEPLIDYILSLQNIGNVKEIITGNRINEFSDYVLSLFKDKGYLDVFKDAGIFISSKPR